MSKHNPENPKPKLKKDEDEEISLIAKFPLNWKINVN